MTFHQPQMVSTMFLRICTILMGLFLMLSASAPAQAQVNIIQVQKLQFGKWHFGDNSSAVTITVSPTGVINSNSPNITMLTPPTPGIYNINGLPAFAPINDVVVLVGLPMQMGADQFTLNNFTTNIADADGLGNTQLRLGADLVTSGDNQIYPGGTYDGEISIEIVY